MRHLFGLRLHVALALAASVCAAIFATPAAACRIRAPIRFEDVKFADLVVVGRIANYRIVRDEAFRRQMLASTHLPADMRKLYEDPRQGLLPGYARFDVEVEEVLVGRAPRRLHVTWDNSTYPEPEQIAPGRYLVALRRPNSPAPTLRGPSATILPDRDPNALTLLQAPCSAAFLYEVGSEQARTVRTIQEARRR